MSKFKISKGAAQDLDFEINFYRFVVRTLVLNPRVKTRSYELYNHFFTALTAASAFINPLPKKNCLSVTPEGTLSLSTNVR